MIIHDKDLILLPEYGMAYQEDRTKSVSYGKKYWKKYINYEGKPIAVAINKGRVRIAKDHRCRCLLDVGIGSGEFIKSTNEIVIYGYDVNEYAVKWLRKQNCYKNPYIAPLAIFDGLTFWDSLEHIQEPVELLRKIPKGMFIFVSIPIFKDVYCIRDSKHYRPNEHYWYFTDKGLRTWMNSHCFDFIEMRDFEIRAGREDIFTYVFKKTK